MYLFIMLFEIIGTIAFALSGAMTGLKRGMDIFGMCVLGVTTACGGGIIRDLILGISPPATFTDPKFVMIALAVSLIVFFPFVRRMFAHNRKLFDTILLITDSAGLGIFTVCGVQVAVNAGYRENTFLVIFVAVMTGVGGGVLRDIFAGDRPYIFVKHIYACAAVLGAALCRVLLEFTSADISMIAGFALIVTIRLCSAIFHWSLPKAKDV